MAAHERLVEPLAREAPDPREMRGGQVEPQLQQQQQQVLPLQQEQLLQQPPQQPLLRRFSIEELQSSWFILFLRVFHAWLFFLAIVTIAGMGVNTFLNMFAEFCEFLLENKRLVDETDRGLLAHLICTAALLVLLYAGLMQRGCWLLLDCLEGDMFINYRRTLCLEGPGTGSFLPCYMRVTVSPDEQRLVNDSLNGEQILNSEIVVGGVTVPRGAQLSNSQDEELAGTPAARMTFLVMDERPASFQRLDCRCVRATADMLFQVAIFFSLDILPLAWGVMNCRSLLSLLSLAWLDRLATFAIKVAVGHVWIYLCVSTLVDYVWKVDGFCRTCSIRRHLQRGTPVPPHRMQAALRTRCFSGSTSRSETLNLCVRLGNLLVLPKCHWALFGSCVLTFVSVIALTHFKCPAVATLLFVLFFMNSILLVHFKCWASARQMGANMQEAASYHLTPLPPPPWALWFRAHCGVTPRAVFITELTAFVLGVSMVLLAVFGLGTGLHAWLLLIASCFLWPIIGMSLAVCYKDRLWIFSLTECAIFGALCVYGAVHNKEEALHLSTTDLTLNTAFLITLTQLGMWRQGKTQAHTISVYFFIIIVVAIATLSLMASSSSTGYWLGSPEFEWCHDNSSCKEFRFPLKGTNRYEFCGISWEMGLGDNVSDRCEDTKLTIVDFGQISSIASYMPNASKVDLAIDEYLPGWMVEHSQTYNVTAGTTTTFIHLKRGSTSVIAVRGTSSVVEVLQDLNLWMRIALLQLARKIGPSCYSTRNILQTFTSNRTVLMANSFIDLANYVEKVLPSSNSTEKLYITGHSLGGGIASAIGGIFNISAVTFSAPGLQATSAILKPPPEENLLLHGSINVAPQWDIVPMVDEHVGSTLRINCKAMQPLKCHRLRSTMCELLTACGDGGGRPVRRDYNRSCQTCQSAGYKPPASCRRQ